MKAIIAPFSFWIIFFVVFVNGLYVTAYAQVPESSTVAVQLPKGNFSDLTETGVATVTDVIDPLTVQLEDGRFIHLAGLDYPDLDYYAPGELSVVAVKVLKDFLLDEPVRVFQSRSEKTGRINRMGREIAHLVRKDDEGWVQGMLISLGLARVRTTKSNPEMAVQMYRLEDMARTEKTGLWEVEAYQVTTPEESKNRTGSFQVVEGVVQSTAMKSNKLYINFGDNWRDDFTVSISASDRRGFKKTGLDPQQWSGKTIRVRGWVESYNGPYIEVDHLEAFELMEVKQVGFPQEGLDQ